MVGLTGQEVTMLGPKHPARKSEGKLVIGAARVGRKVGEPESSSSSGPQATEAGRIPILRFPKSHTGNPLTGGMNPHTKKRDYKGREGKVKREKEQGKRKDAGKPTPRKSNSPYRLKISRGNLRPKLPK